MIFEQARFNDFIFDNNVIGFFKEPIQLKSGRMSNWYVNWRGVTSDAYLVDVLSDFVLAFAKDLALVPDCFYGVPEGATKLAIITQFKRAMHSRSSVGAGDYALPMGRGKPKGHGDLKDRVFLGAPRGRTIVIEDVTTTGGSLLGTLDVLGELYETVERVAAVGLTNRMEVRDDGRSVKQAVEDRGIPYFAMSNALDLLPEASKRLNPGTKILKAIEAEFKKYGVKEL